MSYVKRQELFKNINPLLKKYKYDGEVPPSYIPADKRAKITSYMGRSSFAPGYYEAKMDLEMGNKTSKMHAEEMNQRNTDYTQSLDQRMKEGEEVKQFMNKKRIEYGRTNKETEKHRQRSHHVPNPKEPYSAMISQREEIKENTNKVNCFVDHNEPAFISSMSRTMDAFDLRMQTFGGSQTKNKDKNFDKFISEKRGFIRTSNLYQSNNPVEIVNNEIGPKIMKPGPAFHCSYDNKYNENTSYAHDKGRVKQALDTNKHDKKILAQVERPEYQYRLEQSSIKFDQHELKQPLIDKEEIFNNTLSPSILRELDSPTFNKQNLKEPTSTHFANYNSGGTYSKQIQLVHRNNQSTNSSSNVTPIGGMQGHKNNSVFMDKKKLGFTSASPYSPVIRKSNGLRPYEQWKGNCVTGQETVILGQDKDILGKFDQAPRSYLTKASEIGPNVNDYKSMKKVYHGKHLSVDQSHIELDKGVHKVMKTTTYAIGEKGEGAPNERDSSNAIFHSAKVQKEGQEMPQKYDKNSRRADPENKNRAVTIGFGQGTEAGTKEQAQEYFQSSFYNVAHFGPKHGDFNPNVLHAINKDRGQYNLSNKFQYGLDSSGGALAAKQPDSPDKIKECLVESAVGHNQREEIKEKIERQNFTIQHDKQLQNSDTKQIGNHGGKGIENQIDLDALKKSSVPIKDQPGSLNSYGLQTKKRGSFQGRRPMLGVNTVKSEYEQFKHSSTISKVPFSPEKRNRLEKDFNRFDKPNGYGESLNKAVHSWKMPTYDLNP